MNSCFPFSQSEKGFFDSKKCFFAIRFIWLKKKNFFRFFHLNIIFFLIKFIKGKFIWEIQEIMFKDIFFFDRITRKKFFESKKPFSYYTQMIYWV